MSQNDSSNFIIKLIVLTDLYRSHFDDKKMLLTHLALLDNLFEVSNIDAKGFPSKYSFYKIVYIDSCPFKKIDTLFIKPDTNISLKVSLFRDIGPYQRDIGPYILGYDEGEGYYLKNFRHSDIVRFVNLLAYREGLTVKQILHKFKKSKYSIDGIPYNQIKKEYKAGVTMYKAMYPLSHNH